MLQNVFSLSKLEFAISSFRLDATETKMLKTVAIILLSPHSYPFILTVGMDVFDFGLVEYLWLIF